MRKPLEREFGRYKQHLDKLELIAKDTVESVSNEYPDIDIIDLEFVFEGLLRFQFSRKMLYVEESEVEDGNKYESI